MGRQTRKRGARERRPSRRRRAVQRGGWAAGTLMKGQVGGTRGSTIGTKQPAPGPSQCHPSLKHVKPGESCLPADILKRAAAAAGAASATPAALREALKLPKDATGERALLEALPGISAQEKADIARRTLRPAMPTGWREDPDMWLDSNNIADVLNQYEEAYPEFEFMGPFPIDFAAPDPYAGGAAGGLQPKCLMTEICELRVQKALKSGTKAIGIVYNLDPHFKSGSHWVANYIDIPAHRCYYFDSYGMEPPPQVARFMQWLTTQDPKMRLEYSSRRLQYSNTECGVYSIYFIIRMLAGDSFVELTRRRPSDKDMLDLRDWLFST